MIDERKMSKQPQPAPTASAVGPCPTVIQIVGRPGTESLPSTIAPPDHPFINNKGESKLSVLNITDKPIKLKSGDILGHVCPVSENNAETYKTSQNIQMPEHLQPLIDEVSPELSPEEKEAFKSLISEFQDIFMGPDKKLGQTDLAFHKIDVSEARPIKIPPRKCPLAQREIIEEELDKMLEQKVIEPSDSPWSAPICLVKKADGTYRFAINFRGLNSVTEKMRILFLTSVKYLIRYQGQNGITPWT